MKSEWASCMMSFSERMCSCCLVSTMCRFFRIFMAKVLFSSLLSWTCSQEDRKKCKYKPKASLNINLHSLLYNCKKKNLFMLLSHCSAPYQLDTTKATNPQSIDDVEVRQVEIEEKCILCFIPVEPGKRGKSTGRGLEMTWRMKEEIIHFQQLRQNISTSTQFVCKS